MAWGLALSKQARVGLLGLATNVACLSAPDGGLVDADNVVNRRMGCIEPRDGTKLLATVADTAAHGFSLDDANDVVATWDGSAFAWSIVGGAALQYTDPATAASDPQPFRRDVLTRARIRGNLYVPYEAGTLRLETDGFHMTGLPPVAEVAGGAPAIGTTNWLPDTYSVAYRVVLVRRDADGMEVRSIPSAASTITNNDGADRAVSVNLGMSSAYTSYITAVELYRTRNFPPTVQVDDEMQLVASIDPSKFSVFTPGLSIYVFDDQVAESSRGAAMYTSPSRGGILQQNERPPAAAAVEAFKGHLFFGNVRGPQRKTFSLTWAGDVSGSATGVGYRDYTATRTSGSNQLTVLSSAVGLEKGQYVEGTGIPLGTWVTNISGTTVTMSANATSSGALTAITFRDAVRVDGVWAPADTLYVLPALVASMHYVAYGITPPAANNNLTWVVESISRAAGTDTIQATHGDEFTPALPTYDETPLDLDQDVWPGGLMWSKMNEPEHVAPINYAFVGDKNKAILALIGARDALIVLKEDGAFRLTGANGEWDVAPYDATLNCVLPTSARTFGSRAYFLANSGVVSMSADGAELVSAPVNDLVKPVIEQVLKNFRTNGFYELDGVVGSTAAYFQREGEYTIMRDSSSPMLVFNESRGSWTTWSRATHASESTAYSALFNFDREGRNVYALGSDLFATVLTTDSQLGVQTMPAKNDRETEVTATLYNLSTGVVTLSGAVTALEDDVIQDAAGKLWRVTATVASSATVSVTGPDTVFTTGTCVLYRTIRTTITPQPLTINPMVQKRWGRVYAAYERVLGPVASRFTYSSSENTSPDTEDARYTLTLGYMDYSAGYSVWSRVPNDHKRAWLLRPSLTAVLSHGTFRLEGIFADAEEMAEHALNGEAG